MNTLTSFPPLQILGIAVAILLGLVVLIKAAKSLQAQKLGSEPGSPIKARKVLTPRQQPMYVRLVEAFPEHIILAQVAYSALLETRLSATESRFDREKAAFVICTTAFEVIGIVELDDAGGNEPAPQHAAGCRMLAEAGYEVLRYNGLPDAQTIRRQLLTVAQG